MGIVDDFRATEFNGLRLIGGRERGNVDEDRQKPLVVPGADGLGGAGGARQRDLQLLEDRFWITGDGVFIGMQGFGASAPAEALYKEFGITSDAIVAAVKRKLG